MVCIVASDRPAELVMPAVWTGRGPDAGFGGPGCALVAGDGVGRDHVPGGAGRTDEPGGQRAGAGLGPGGGRGHASTVDPQHAAVAVRRATRPARRLPRPGARAAGARPVAP